MTDCPCAALDDALHTVDELRARIELLTRRVERLIVQARRQGIVLADAVDQDDLFGGSDLSAVLGISRARLYQLAQLPTFPKQVRPGKWSAVQVMAWWKTRPKRGEA
jgi:predicted DNA-binding transcriptional regulator AlpA